MPLPGEALAWVRRPVGPLIPAGPPSLSLPCWTIGVCAAGSPVGLEEAEL